MRSQTLTIVYRGQPITLTVESDGTLWANSCCFGIIGYDPNEPMARRWHAVGKMETTTDGSAAAGTAITLFYRVVRLCPVLARASPAACYCHPAIFSDT